MEKSGWKHTNILVEALYEWYLFSSLSCVFHILCTVHVLLFIISKTISQSMLHRKLLSKTQPCPTPQNKGSVIKDTGKPEVQVLVSIVATGLLKAFKCPGRKYCGSWSTPIWSLEYSFMELIFRIFILLRKPFSRLELLGKGKTLWEILFKRNSKESKSLSVRKVLSLLQVATIKGETLQSTKSSKRFVIQNIVLTEMVLSWTLLKKIPKDWA